MNRFFLAAFLVLAGCAAVPPRADAVFNVADNYRPLRYAATADQTTFSVTWPFESQADLRVMSSLDDGATWEDRDAGTEWTATGAGQSSGGSVVFVTGRVADELVVIYRNDGIDRTAQFTTLTPTGVNQHLDRQTTQIQQVENIAENRALQVPVQHDFAGSGFSPVLPQLDPADIGFSIVVSNFHCQGTNTDCDSALDCDDALCVPTGFEYEANEAGEIIDTFCPTAYAASNRLLKSANTSCGTATTGCSTSGTNSDSVSCPGNFIATGYHQASLGLRAANGSSLRLEETVASSGSEFIDILPVTDQPYSAIIYWPDDVPAVGEGLAIASVSNVDSLYTVTLDWSVPQTESPPYDIAMWQPGFPTDSQFVAGHVFDRAVTCADDFAGSQAKFSANFAATKVYDIYKNTSDIGDMTCSSGGSTCIFITGAIGTTSFAAGDTLRLYAPSTVDTTARDMMVTFKCTR